MRPLTKIKVLTVNHYCYDALTNVQYVLLSYVLMYLLSLILNDKRLALSILTIIVSYYVVKTILSIFLNFVNSNGNSVKRVMPAICMLIGLISINSVPDKSYLLTFAIVVILRIIFKRLNLTIFKSLVTIEHSDFASDTQSPTHYLSILNQSVKDKFFVSKVIHTSSLDSRGSSTDGISVTYTLANMPLPPEFTISHHFSKTQKIAS